MGKREEYMRRFGLIGCCEWCGDWVKQLVRGEMYCGRRCWQKDNPEPVQAPTDDVPSLSALLREWCDEYGDNAMPDEDAKRATEEVATCPFEARFIFRTGSGEEVTMCPSGRSLAAMNAGVCPWCEEPVNYLYPTWPWCTAECRESYRANPRLYPDLDDDDSAQGCRAVGSTMPDKTSNSNRIELNTATAEDPNKPG